MALIACGEYEEGKVGARRYTKGGGTWEKVRVRTWGNTEAQGHVYSRNRMDTGADLHSCSVPFPAPSGPCPACQWKAVA